MASTKTLLTGLWPVTLIVILSATQISCAPLLQDENFDVKLLSSTASPLPGGGDEEKTNDGHWREDIVPLDSADEQAKFLTTLLMLEDLQEGRPGAKIGHPERLQSDEEVMTEFFKLYQNQAFSGKRYLKIPPKLMKKMRTKLKELMSE